MCFPERCVERGEKKGKEGMQAGIVQYIHVSHKSREKKKGKNHALTPSQTVCMAFHPEQDDRHGANRMVVVFRRSTRLLKSSETTNYNGASDIASNNTNPGTGVRLPP